MAGPEGGSLPAGASTPGVILELYVLLGLEGAGILLIRLHLLEELGILCLDVPGSVKSLVCLEGQAVVGRTNAAYSGCLAFIYVA